MRLLSQVNNPYGDDKNIDGCALFGMINVEGTRFPFKDPIRAISNMRERGNGLGGGFAIYGIYPDHRELYAFHVMYLNRQAKRRVEKSLKEKFRVVLSEELPTKEAKVWNPPLIWRYFIEPNRSKVNEEKIAEDDYVVKNVMHINVSENGRALIFSSGKNMGVFKGVGYPEDIAEYFCLEEYEGYMWVCHSRYPTNTPGWWGGAHPFSLLDWAVAHNGELSSYGTNRRFLETYGYKCTMQTDTEVFTYAFDLLVRRHKIPLELVSKILTPPFWDEIDCMPQKQKQLLTALRQTYSGLLMNGPFSVIVAQQGQMIGLTDRIKLRPLTAGVKGDFLYLSSEEAAIRVVQPTLDKVWNLTGGEMVVGTVKAHAFVRLQLVTTLLGN
ncbi:MAG: glutamine amidotransferase family protein [Nitrososphaerota archaeon]|nr:glutamine amidotransferase family protein [Candidatus Bathyarchaeota archaeon]MDW8193208.1 glutamine amidotransferase family protein [Nitrososphaerota archaeon]